LVVDLQWKLLLRKMEKRLIRWQEAPVFRVEARSLLLLVFP
jgi:hypothetical protein